jgi:hypothetical protein
MTKSWTVELDHDEEGNLVLPLNEEILAQAGWKTGDRVQWTDNHDGTWSLTKAETEYVLVDAISTFRMRYAVEVPKGKSDWALDTVSLNEAQEFSQEHIGEQIVSHRVISKEQFIEICDQDNHYCASWPDEKKFDVFLTPLKELE